MVIIDEFLFEEWFVCMVMIILRLINGIEIRILNLEE